MPRCRIWRKQRRCDRDDLQRIGTRGRFCGGPYGTFKAAIIHYTQGLAYQLASKGIRANSVSPGNTYFEGGVWNMIKDNNPNCTTRRWHSILPAAWARRRRWRMAPCFCEPGREFHHGHEPCRGRRPDPRRPVLGMAFVAGCEEASR
jgi:NAD(P)-dependent dehydrogenase (short-subunit alcohol dehydrogenase family)